MRHILERTEQYLKQLGANIECNVLPVDNVEICDDRYGNGPWRPFARMEYWGKHDTWCRFRATVTVPPEYAGKRVGCRVTSGRATGGHPLNPQFLITVNGEVCQAIDKNHTTFDLSMQANPGDRYAIEFEAYAGREAISGVEWYHPNFQDEPAQFRLDTYIHNASVEALYYDLHTARLAAKMFKEDNYDRIRMENCLTAALNLLDCRMPGTPQYLASVENAHNYMAQEFYGKLCSEKPMTANCIGHSHIDVAWLWTLEQTRAKAVRSFSTEIKLMEEYPEHRFTSSQPQLYQFVKEECPELYEKIRQRVKEGRWEVEGAMWLEADCNLTSGESLIRQLLHGKRFMKQEFDVDSRILWLPDVFGYSAALPQILKKSGVDTFITSKISWNDTNHLPVDTFLWQGIDGTEIFSQFITGATDAAELGDGDKYSTYSSWLSPISVAKGWEMYQQKDINKDILISFGVGDGGGGVTREMLEIQRRMAKGIPGMPQTRLTTVTDTVQRIRKNTEGKKLPKWVGELYLELHRGTYTSIAKIKRNNRKAEFLLQAAEAASLTNKLLAGGSYDKEGLYTDWTTVLLNQFHDIIPGSSIKEVYEDSEAQFAQVFADSGARFDGALKALAEGVSKAGVFVYNPAATAQSGVVTCGGKQYYAEDVPAYGWKVLDEKQDVLPPMKISATCLENDFFRITLDATGAFTEIYDKQNDRQVLTPGMRGNVLEAYDDRPYPFDNWEVSYTHREKMWQINDVAQISVGECTPYSATLHISRKFLSSSLEQDITIYRNSPRIDFDTRADWHEHHILLKTVFPVDILADKASFEIQYGAVERPTHSNTSWDEAKFEVCAQKWADFGEADYGVALLNDCKYGHDIHDGQMRLTLIKCGTYPNPEADQGEHSFRYSLMPHSGTWREAGVVNAAYAFNCPMLALPAQGKGSLPACFGIALSDKTNVLVTVAKEACDSEDIILRAYEAEGKRTKAAITCGFAVKQVQEVDMMEQEVYDTLQAQNGTFTAAFKPYEIKTFRIRK